MNKDEALMQIISIRLKAEEIFNTLRTGSMERKVKQFF